MRILNESLSSPCIFALGGTSNKHRLLWRWRPGTFEHPIFILGHSGQSTCPFKFASSMSRIFRSTFLSCTTWSPLPPTPICPPTKSSAPTLRSSTSSELKSRGWERARRLYLCQSTGNTGGSFTPLRWFHFNNDQESMNIEQQLLSGGSQAIVDKRGIWFCCPATRFHVATWEHKVRNWRPVNNDMENFSSYFFSPCLPSGKAPEGRSWYQTNNCTHYVFNIGTAQMDDQWTTPFGRKIFHIHLFWSWYIL